MARGNAVIDIGTDPFAERARHRRTLLRIGVPVLGVVLMIAAIVAITAYAHRANRAGALALSEDVLAALDARISQEVASYVGPAARVLRIGNTLARSEPPGDRRRALVEKFSIGALQQVPQIAAFTFADTEGDFAMVRRNDATGGIDTKLIWNAPGARKVLWIRRNAAGDETAHEEDPNDPYDPRTRPWYGDALKTNSIVWTDVYTFFTADEPGITASLRFDSTDGRTFVTGIDITLANLSRFLASLQIGVSGRAMIIDSDGRLIAYPEGTRVLRHAASGPVTARVDEIGDDVAAGVYDRFRIEGPGHRTVTIGGERYLSTYSPLHAQGHNWAIMIVVPESDFVGFVARNNRTALAMSLVIVALAALLAVLLARQGLRGDRATRLALEQTQAIARQSEAFEHLASDPNLFDSGQNRLPEALTETAADIAGARRASLWYLHQDSQLLRCADSFHRETSVHTAGFELQQRELPRFFEQLASGVTIDVPDAASDPRTSEMHRLMMASVGSRSFLMLPVRRDAHAIGALLVEDPANARASRQSLRMLASIAAMRVAEQADSMIPRDADPAVGPGEPAEIHSLSADLALRGLDEMALGGALYPEVSVLFMRIEDPAAAARSGRMPELIDAIACAFQEIANEQEIPYLKLVGYDIIGAAGFQAGDPTATARIANTAIAGRDRIARLFEVHGLEPDFRLGIDCGIAIGSSIGTAPRFFNLWGEAVRTAQTMAASALPGAIQTSETAYLRLRQSFLFRPRGTFFLPHVGAAQTFLLAGRL